MTTPVPVRLTTVDGVRLAALLFRGAGRGDGPDNRAGSAERGGDTDGRGDPVGGSGEDGRGNGLPGARAIGCVVAHGFTGSGRDRRVQWICRTLAARGFDVLVADFRGHGRSGGVGTAGIDEVHDVAAAVQYLRAGGAVTVATLGWSMGGTAVLRHAGLGGDTDIVVSVSAPGTWWERGTRSMRVVHWLIGTRTGRVVTRLARGTRVTARDWADPPPAPAELVGRIAPRHLLLVHGDADHYFPLHHVESLSAAAPHASVWIEAGMRHAEAATSADLLRRIGDWIVAAVAVCDDDGCD